jgi:hypothetical protein
MPTRALRCSLLSALAVVVFCQAASAATIFLSEFSSDQTSASQLAATLDFQVIGNTINLTVANQTTAPNDFAIDAIYFNVTDAVGLESLTLNAVAGSACPSCRWDLVTDPSDMRRQAGGFGMFDVALIGPNGRHPLLVEAGETLLFELTADGAFDMFDFTTELSTIPPGDTPSIGAAKFVRGPGDDSAVGGTVPEPSTALLVLAGLTGLAVARRRQAR